MNADLSAIITDAALGHVITSPELVRQGAQAGVLVLQLPAPR